MRRRTDFRPDKEAQQFKRKNAFIKGGQAAVNAAAAAYHESDFLPSKSELEAGPNGFDKALYVLRFLDFLQQSWGDIDAPTVLAVDLSDGAATVNYEGRLTKVRATTPAARARKTVRFPGIIFHDPAAPIDAEFARGASHIETALARRVYDNAINAADFEVVQVVERVWGYQFAQAGKTKYAPATTDAVFAPHGRSASLNDAICRRVLTISRSGVAYQNCCLDDLQELAAARIKEEAKHKNLNSTNAAFALDGETAQAKGPYLSSKEELGAKVQRMGAVAGLRDTWRRSGLTEHVSAQAWPARAPHAEGAQGGRVPRGPLLRGPPDLYSQRVPGRRREPGAPGVPRVASRVRRPRPLQSAGRGGDGGPRHGPARPRGRAVAYV